jgi:hypothetical protein
MKGEECCMCLLEVKINKPMQKVGKNLKRLRKNLNIKLFFNNFAEDNSSKTIKLLLYLSLEAEKKYLIYKEKILSS